MKTLSQSLEEAIQKPTWGDAWQTLGAEDRGRAFGLAWMITSLPSALPLPAPGYSTPFGFLIIILAIQWFWGASLPWMPLWLKERPIPEFLKEKAIPLLNQVFKVTEKWLRPRPISWFRFFPLYKTLAATCALLGLIMMIPVPGTNTLPAFLIFLLSLALASEDEFWIPVINLVAALVGILYVAVIVLILVHGLSSVKEAILWLKSHGL